MNNSLSKSRHMFESFKKIKIQRGLSWGVIILGALIAFEIFNFFFFFNN